MVQQVHAATSAVPRSNADAVMHVVYGVHAIRPREICATQFITATLTAAEQYAEIMSSDPGVLAAAVTGYIMEVEGRSRAHALYVDGQRQQAPHISNDRRINANGHGSASTVRR